MTKILGPALGYTDMLDEATTAKALKELSKRDKSPIRPSASGQCTRELYHGLMEFHGKASYPKEVLEPSKYRIFSLGHSIEYHLIKEFALLKDSLDIRYKQQTLSFEWLEAKANPKMSQWLEGSLDLVFWSEKYKCVADVKSKGDYYDFKARKDKWAADNDKLGRMASVEKISKTAFWVEDLAAFLEELKDPFFEANFLQLNLYANSQFLKERGIDHASIIQYAKKNSLLREIRFKPSREVYEKVIKKFQTALDAAAEGDPTKAPQDHEQGSPKCNYCPYKLACWGAKNVGRKVIR